MPEEFDGPVVVKGLIDVTDQGTKPGRVKATNFEAHKDFGTFMGNLVDVRDVQCTNIRPKGDGQVLLDGGLGVTRDLNVNGNVNLLGDVQLIGADVAEEFRVTGDRPAEPGSVMVLSGVDSIAVSETPYDHRVAGIVSGAGNYRPGIVLDRQSAEGRSPLALSGKVWCLVDADEEAIALGDLLTTSATPGHAMRAGDRARAFGAVIGKALGNLQSGRGLVPVFIALQ
jgi:hypothetical protein